MNAGETTILSLRDFRTQELKSAGIEVSSPVEVRINARGGGGASGWMSKGEEGMFASAWIIDAVTRRPVWEMTVRNSTSSSKDDREFDGRLSLAAGKYEVYFSAPIFSHKSWKSHVVLNIDHRRSSLFGDDENQDAWFLKGWWSDDIPEMWEERAGGWGIDLLVDDGQKSRISSSSPSASSSLTVFRATGLGDDVIIRQGMRIKKDLSLKINCIGEIPVEDNPVDFGWIVNAETREPVWEMGSRNSSHAGGALKNRIVDRTIHFDKGRYVVYFVTDDSHSTDDWNSFPPYDPTSWGITLSARSDDDLNAVDLFEYEEIRNVVVAIKRVGDDEHLQEGFTLKRPAAVRIYAFGEKSHSRRELADYGYLMDARTREKVWTMDVDRSLHAGGATKNVCVDEVVTLPAGSYLVSYTTDDSHSYDDWNAKAPFDQENYGITVMLAGENPDRSIVGTYDDERARGLIAQIITVRDGADRKENFTLDAPTRVRVYAIGEGQKRSMYDYGWIESVGKGVTVWEMTYSMTFHAGGARKNRMVSTTILLDKGEYVLRYVSDDSHSFGDWNEDPPDDQRYWGITVYKDESDPPLPPQAPSPPR